MNNFRLVKIKWIDSFGVGSSWESLDDVKLDTMVLKTGK